MMFGSKVKYGITLSQNQADFNIYKRRYEHNFKSTLLDENLNRSSCVEIKKIQAFLVSKKNNVRLFDSLTFKVRSSIDIDIEES